MKRTKVELPSEDIFSYGKLYGGGMETISQNNVEYIRSLFVKYLDDMVFTKRQDTDIHSIYMAKIASHTKSKRYIIAIISKDDFEPGKLKKLSVLPWISLQMKSFDEDIPFLKPNVYTIKKDIGLNIPMQMESKNANHTIYKINDLPIKVTMICNKNNTFEFPHVGNLISAVEMYQTVITISEV